MKIANPYSDPKLYIWLVIEGFLDFMKYIAKVDLKGMNISVESEISHICPCWKCALNRTVKENERLGIFRKPSLKKG